ncbi:MAG: hypothetical protein ACR2J3_04810 [Aridibacter sp.]
MNFKDAILPNIIQRGIVRITKINACVWFQPKKGDETVGWISFDKLDFQTDNSAENGWVGEWKYADGNIKITPFKVLDNFKIYGTAMWGAGNNVHVGEIDFSAEAKNNKIIKPADDEYDCQVKMQKLGKYLIVSDNKNCGGVNVTFDGVYLKK